MQEPDYNYYTGPDYKKYPNREAFVQEVQALDFSKSGMVGKDLLLLLQTLTPEQLELPVFVIHNLNDGVEGVVGVALETPGEPAAEADKDLCMIRIKLEGDVGRGIVDYSKHVGPVEDHPDYAQSRKAWDELK